MPAKPQAMTAAEFKSRQALMRWTNPQTAERLHVSLSTIEKWRAGAVPVPGTAAALLIAVMAEKRAALRG